jgi:succinyl-CoA synthetase beta subunit
MDLLEYAGKQLFARHGLPVPDSVLYTEDGLDGDLPDSDEVVVKAQVPAGKREEHGGIKIVPQADAEDTAETMLDSTVAGEPVAAVLIEEKVDIADELYISLSINRAGKQYHLVFSEQGGSGIETVADADPDAVHLVDGYKFTPELLEREFKSLEHSGAIIDAIQDLYTVMREEDALLAEINPLVITADGRVVATDAKVRLDEDALYRHDDSLHRRNDAGELEFVKLDGNIGVIGNGAGLVMATLDTIHQFGGEPADFLDIGGGADFETMKQAMRTVQAEAHIDGMFVNIFGGITRCDEVAQGIIDFVEAENIDLPLVVRMVGTNQREGRDMLEEHGIHALDSMDACAETIVDLVEGDADAA